MKKHVVFRNCTVAKTEIGVNLKVFTSDLLTGPRGNAIDLNPEFAKGDLYNKVVKLQNSGTIGEELQVGDLYVGVGGMPIFDGAQFDLVNLGGEEITKRIVERFGKITKFAFTVFRGWGAPRTHGVTEGGAAGIFDVAAKYGYQLTGKIAEEIQEEIGIIAVNDKGQTGWVGYKFLDLYQDTDSVMLEKGKEVWNLYYPPIAVIETYRYKKATLGDSLSFTGWPEVSLAFEKQNATVEILMLFSATLQKGFRYSVVDKEVNLPKPRAAGVVCFAESGKHFILPFIGGEFVEGLPAIPISQEFLQYSCNTKFRRLYEDIKNLVL